MSFDVLLYACYVFMSYFPLLIEIVPYITLNNINPVKTECMQWSNTMIEVKEFMYILHYNRLHKTLVLDKMCICRIIARINVLMYSVVLSSLCVTHMYTSKHCMCIYDTCMYSCLYIHTPKELWKTIFTFSQISNTNIFHSFYSAYLLKDKMLSPTKLVSGCTSRL